MAVMADEHVLPLMAAQHPVGRARRLPVAAMRHSSAVRSGSLAADHRHLYTAENLHYRAAFEREGNRVAWEAEVRLHGEVVGQLHGITRVDRPDSNLLEVVRHAVDDEIDRRHFVA